MCPNIGCRKYFGTDLMPHGHINQVLVFKDNANLLIDPNWAMAISGWWGTSRRQERFDRGLRTPHLPFGNGDCICFHRELLLALTSSSSLIPVVGRSCLKLR